MSIDFSHEVIMKRPLYPTTYKTFIFDKTGITFGAGVYFSPNAQLSERFCSKDVNGNAHIFSVQVLTGYICQGHSGLIVLPPRPGKDHMTYDSAADNPANPTEVVIFHDSQAYPAYHVLFT